MRRLLALLLLVGGPLLVLARRRRAADGPRVRLHYADGSLVELEPGAAGADRLVGLARQAL